MKIRRTVIGQTIVVNGFSLQCKRLEIKSDYCQLISWYHNNMEKIITEFFQ